MIRRWLWKRGIGGAAIIIVASTSVVVAKRIEDSDSSLRKRITRVDERITEEIDKQLGKYVPVEDQKPTHHCSRHRDNIYLVPHWPTYSLFFNYAHLVSVNMHFDTASQAYSGRGSTENMARLIFGEPDITIKDILLASKLASTGKIVAASLFNTVDLTKKNHYLSFLADQEVVLDASLQQYGIALDYEHSYRNGSVILGFHLPVKIRHQSLKLVNDLTPENRVKIQKIAQGFQVDGTSVGVLGPGIPSQPLIQSTDLQFATLYNNNFENFVATILARKGISLNKKETVLGVSDVMGYVNLDIPTRYANCFITGMSLLLPTAKCRDVNKLWDNDFGNGGFAELSAYTSLLWQRNRWFNPHMHIKATYSFAANVDRRVPKQNIFTASGATATFNGISVGMGNPSTRGSLILGETFKFQDAIPFNEPDSTVRNFADQAISVKIHRGPEFLCRVGNTFDAMFLDHGFFDIYYDLYVKGKDYVARRRKDDVFQAAILSHNTYVVSHVLGASYSYQCSAQVRLRAGMSYVVAGRNMPKRVGAELIFNAEF